MVRNKEGKVKRLIWFMVLIGWIGSSRAADQEDPAKSATCGVWKTMTAIDQTRSGGSLRRTWVHGYLIGLVAMNARYSVAIADLWPGSLTVESVVAEIDVSCRTLPEDAMLPVVIMDMANKARKKF